MKNEAAAHGSGAMGGSGEHAAVAANILDDDQRDAADDRRLYEKILLYKCVSFLFFFLLVHAA